MKIKLSKHVLAAMAAMVTFLVGAAAYAQSTPEISKIENNRWFAIAAAIGLGIAAMGGGIGQGRAAAAALDGISRNPSASGKIFVPMLLGLALIESLVIYSLVIAFQLVGKFN